MTHTCPPGHPQTGDLHHIPGLSRGWDDTRNELGSDLAVTHATGTCPQSRTPTWLRRARNSGAKPDASPAAPKHGR